MTVARFSDPAPGVETLALHGDRLFDHASGVLRRPAALAAQATISRGAAAVTVTLPLAAVTDFAGADGTVGASRVVASDGAQWPIETADLLLAGVALGG